MPKYKVFYAKNSRFRVDEALNLRDLVLKEKTHAQVKEVEFADLETVFSEMQALPWSTVWLEENIQKDNSMLESKGVYHTSMSVGDCILDTETDTLYQCDMVGWKEVV